MTIAERKELKMLAWIIGTGIVAIAAFLAVIAACAVKIIDFLQEYDEEEGCDGKGESEKGRQDESNA